jgi:protein CpxP
MNAQKVDRFEKYAVIIMALVAITFFIAKPVFANEACQHGHWDKARHAEFFEKRKAELHDKLQLTASQEADWNAFMEKVKPVEHTDRASWAEIAKLPTPERLDRLLSMRQERLKRMEARVQATKEFYSHLTTEQQQIFDASMQHRHHTEDRG